jgi:AraC family transcriptional regulator of adaptative response/methylated-DNA-[protein]-cysteine methyltransferase
VLKKSLIETPMGSMIAIADDHVLYLLEFADYRGLEREVERVKRQTKSAITLGRSSPIALLEAELSQYFDGQLKSFKTPLFFSGTPFQKSVWEELKNIPYGETRSYGDIAKKIGKPTAYRAVAQANGANQLAIIVPCHRVINTGGALGGYAGGIERKKWLLNRELSTST